MQVRKLLTTGVFYYTACAADTEPYDLSSSRERSRHTKEPDQMFVWYVRTCFTNPMFYF